MSQFWPYDPKAILASVDIIPHDGMTINEKFNAITRFVILITIILLLLGFAFWWLFLIICLVLVICFWTLVSCPSEVENLRCIKPIIKRNTYKPPKRQYPRLHSVYRN